MVPKRQYKHITWIIDNTFSFSSFSRSGSMSVMQFLTLKAFLCLESTRAVSSRWEFDDKEDGINLIFLNNLPCDWRIPCKHENKENHFFNKEISCKPHWGETVMHQEIHGNKEIHLSMSKEKMCLIMLCILYWYVKNFIPN